MIVTETAASQFKQIMDNQNLTDVNVRVYMKGQCSCGKVHYGMGFDDKVADDDQTFEAEGVKFVLDGTVAPTLDAATIDFVENESMRGFSITDPNAQGCSCGH